MMQYAGMFFARDARSMANVMDAPCAILGRHALCAQGSASDGGAIACAFGLMRDAKSLAARLRAGGIPFDPDGGPSALALAAYRLWGERYPQYLEGPVSTVIIDQDAQKLYITRDRMGEQAVYYLARGACVAFSDAPGALLQAPIARRAVDREGLRELLALGPARTPGLTPIPGLKSLEPGCMLVAGDHGQRIVRYFQLEARPHEEDEAATVERVRALLEDALGRVLCLGPASMLSGGLDSTALTALAAAKGPVETWSVGYEQDQDHFVQNSYQHERDQPYIERAVELLGVNHHWVTLNQQELFDALHPAMIARGLPGMADVDASLLLFAQRIGRNNQYVLSGECADEVFGGYPWFHRSQLMAADGFPWSGSLALRESVLRPSVRQVLDLPGYAAARYHEACAHLPRLSGEEGEQARLRLLQGLCFQWFMPVLQDRARCMCAASGVKVLTPYCDDRLAQYLYNVPWALKNMGGQEKGLLRQAVAGLLPPDLLQRRKSPYPKTHHPGYAQLVCRQMARVLEDDSSPILEVLDREQMYRLMSGGMSAADTPWFGQLMTGPQMVAYLLQVNDFLLTYNLELEL